MEPDIEQSKLFVILYDLPSQKPAIQQYCFGSCGQIIVGTMRIMMDGYELTALACYETQCPALDREMQEPCGTLEETGNSVYLRKLQEGG